MRGNTEALPAWSSGKDSAWSLYLLQERQDLEVVGLLTTINELHSRVAMHAVRKELLEAQAQAVGIPLWEVPIPSPCSNAEYEAAMSRVISRAKAEGISAVAFGDLFLEDVRRYRERLFSGTGISPVFPVWGKPTRELARQMLDAGLRARVTCVDPKQLPRSFAGREFDVDFLKDLPSGVDPCGERGEFHTFVYDGPMFRHPMPIDLGEIVERDGFGFADLLLAGAVDKVEERES